MVESVVISALIWSRVTRSPLTSPQSAPVASPARSPASAGRCIQDTATPAITPASASVEPIERSNVPPIIKSIMPVTRMPFCAAFSITAEKL